MHRIPFDRDAIPLTPPEARRLLQAGGFEILRTDFLFLFPRMLKWLRGLETLLVRWPLGAQLQRHTGSSSCFAAGPVGCGAS